ncbi:unnamed protein product [Paramecium octaurelia]|uniref:Transmembrane protein n=1 Tax=Paramecium octaurelia TaxID=43137 RepID=A0A8S1YJL4_PAROT|nr:unnamed protein product [Paramecium octaurelia]
MRCDFTIISIQCIDGYYLDNLLQNILHANSSMQQMLEQWQLLFGLRINLYDEHFKLKHLRVSLQHDSSINKQSDKLQTLQCYLIIMFVILYLVIRVKKQQLIVQHALILIKLTIPLFIVLVIMVMQMRVILIAYLAKVLVQLIQLIIHCDTCTDQNHQINSVLQYIRKDKCYSNILLHVFNVHIPVKIVMLMDAQHASMLLSVNTSQECTCKTGSYEDELNCVACASP